MFTFFNNYNTQEQVVRTEPSLQYEFETADLNEFQSTDYEACLTDNLKYKFSVQWNEIKQFSIQYNTLIWCTNAVHPNPNVISEIKASSPGIQCYRIHSPGENPSQEILSEPQSWIDSFNLRNEFDFRLGRIFSRYQTFKINDRLTYNYGTCIVPALFQVYQYKAKRIIAFHRSSSRPFYKTIEREDIEDQNVPMEDAFIGTNPPEEIKKPATKLIFKDLFVDAWKYFNMSPSETFEALRALKKKKLIKVELDSIEPIDHNCDGIFVKGTILELIEALIAKNRNALNSNHEKTIYDYIVRRHLAYFRFNNVATLNKTYVHVTLNITVKENRVVMPKPMEFGRYEYSIQDEGWLALFKNDNLFEKMYNDFGYNPPTLEFKVFKEKMTETDLIKIMVDQRIGNKSTIVDHLKKLKSISYITSGQNSVIQITDRGSKLINFYKNVNLTEQMLESTLKQRFEEDLELIRTGDRNKEDVRNQYIAEYQNILNLLINTYGN